MGTDRAPLDNPAMINKTKVERIIDTVVVAAGLPRSEVLAMLEEHWIECNRRAGEGAAPHRPEGWQEEARDKSVISSGLDPNDTRMLRTFKRIVDVSGTG